MPETKTVAELLTEISEKLYDSYETIKHLRVQLEATQQENENLKDQIKGCELEMRLMRNHPAEFGVR